jgi:4'-phosphopantetheinyl transferase EntD
VIAEVRPAGAQGAESFGDQDPAALDLLMPQEREAIAHAGLRRRSEFAAVRHAARQALAALGHPPAALLPGASGAPQWPTGVVGSMTHCTGYRACVVARTHDLAAIGIDAEPNAPLPPGAQRLVLLPAERRQAHELARTHPDIAWTRLLFSAKEAAYKAWNTLTGRPLHSDDVQITLTREGTLSATMSSPPQPPRTRTLHGRWLLREDILLTALSAPAEG